jgi:hypothetical protein
MGWKLEVAPAGISREACLQQRLHLLPEIPADLGLCDTKNRGRLPAVSLLPHALDSTGQAGLPPVLNTRDRESAPTAADEGVLRPGQEAGKRVEMAANGFCGRCLESVINRQDTVLAMNA